MVSEKDKKISEKIEVIQETEAFSSDAFWTSEIKALLDDRPLSLEQALERISDSVVSKFAMPDSAQMRQFIKEFIECDPSLTDAIRRELGL